jgi:tRNA (guanine37-N1)-methyltransferase
VSKEDADEPPLGLQGTDGHLDRSLEISGGERERERRKDEVGSGELCFMEEVDLRREPVEEIGRDTAAENLDRPGFGVNRMDEPSSLQQGHRFVACAAAEIDSHSAGPRVSVCHLEGSTQELHRFASGRPFGVVRPDAFVLKHCSNVVTASTLDLVKINVITMFPDFFNGPLAVSIVRRAIEDHVIDVELHDLREHGLGKHRQLDDAPFGGGPGMVMMIEPLARAIAPFEDTHRVFFTPAGAPMVQGTLDRWASHEAITFVCGRYEGVDQRFVDHFIDEEVSLGDYVLAGGEVAATAAIEGIARLLPGVVGNPESTEKESFRDGLLEEPVYTRPAIYAGWEVPEILLSGDHAKIEQWRQERRIERTRLRRPELGSNGKESDT